MANEIFKDEILSDDELDNVAGGTMAESEEISKIIGYVRFPNGAYTYLPAGGGIMDEYLKDHFGIDAKTDGGDRWTRRQGSPNSYSYNGQQISHGEAVKIILNKLGR